MLSISRIRGPLIMSIFPLQKYLPERSTVDEEEAPMERLKKIFVYKEYEPISKELRSIFTITTAAAFSGMLIGGTLQMRGAVEKFVDNNMATQFYSHFEAKKELQHSVMLQFIKGAYKLGWRAALFTAIFASIQTSLTTYYGKFSVLHYMAGAGIAGFLFKMSLGLKGSLVGLIVGSVLGGIVGFIYSLVFKVTGLGIHDVQAVQQQWYLARQEAYLSSMKKTLNDDVVQMRSLNAENEKTNAMLSTIDKKIEEAKSGVKK